VRGTPADGTGRGGAVRATWLTSGGARAPRPLELRAASGGVALGARPTWGPGRRDGMGATRRCARAGARGYVARRHPCRFGLLMFDQPKLKYFKYKFQISSYEACRGTIGAHFFYKG
jgi:hypothetical protein